jgi:RNA polymerase sigma-70 factor (ECF subfamily)
MSFFLRRVGHYAEAEDLTQQVFLRLLGAGELDRIEDAEAFVFTVATNLLRDRARRAARSASSIGYSLDDGLIDQVLHELVEDRSPERVILARESLADVLRSLDALGERTRDIFILSRLENMKHRNIAELYGISASTVEKHVMKAALHLALRYRRE